ncbi:Spy0128 family protein [Parablautia sp. Marseille-Q6255]|uniref:Spy0128 family protein n=1 Tax=Parablautia sp. Marseille-Q6255 TaxID=3039593 RepID=UPI0024BCFAD9|nr:FctA domain-containing protein [Parablautia sp. Marseille-Q6255]
MRKNKRVLVFIGLLFGFLCIPARWVLAASDMIEVPLMVKQNFEVKNPEKEILFIGNYEFRALDENIPMPEEIKENKWSFSLSGEQAETTISLQFSHEGTYHYQLLQTSKDKERYEYDRSCYNITIYIKTDADGKLIPQVIAEKGDGKKYGDLQFQNYYQGEDTEMPQPSKPGNSGGTSNSGGGSNTIGSNKPVKTGDTTQIMAYVLVAISALFLFAMLICFRKHRQEK